MRAEEEGLVGSVSQAQESELYPGKLWAKAGTRVERSGGQIEVQQTTVTDRMGRWHWRMTQPDGRVTRQAEGRALHLPLEPQDTQ